MVTAPPTPDPTSSVRGSMTFAPGRTRRQAPERQGCQGLCVCLRVSSYRPMPSPAWRPPGLALSAPSLSSTCEAKPRRSGHEETKAEDSARPDGPGSTRGRSPPEPRAAPASSRAAPGDRKERLCLSGETGRLQQPQVDPQRIGRQQLSLHQRSKD